MAASEHTQAPEPTGSIDRVTIVQIIVGLTSSDLARVVALIEGAATHISHQGTVPERAAELVRWAESPTGPGLAAVHRVLARFLLSPPRGEQETAAGPPSFLVPFPRDPDFVSFSHGLDQLPTTMSEPKTSPTSGDKSLDILGLKGFSDAAKILTKGAVEGAGAFLSRICLPAAEEFGLFLQDQIKEWRRRNAVRIANVAETKLREAQGDKEVHAPPRIVIEVLEKGSWVDNEELQDMWAGLLASACTENGTDDSNIVFINIISQITASEARLIKWMVEHSVVVFTDDYYHKIYMTGKYPERDLLEMTGSPNPDVMHGQFQHLQTLGLIDKVDVDAIQQHEAHHCYVSIHGTALALRFYARCNGSAESIWHYYEFHKFYGIDKQNYVDLHVLLSARAD